MRLSVSDNGSIASCDRPQSHVSVRTMTKSLMLTALFVYPDQETAVAWAVDVARAYTSGYVAHVDNGLRKTHWFQCAPGRW
jgi:hypothetical protein